MRGLANVYRLTWECLIFDFVRHIIKMAATPSALPTLDRSNKCTIPSLSLLRIACPFVRLECLAFFVNRNCFPNNIVAAAFTSVSCRVSTGRMFLRLSWTISGPREVFLTVSALLASSKRSKGIPRDKKYKVEFTKVDNLSSLLNFMRSRSQVVGYLQRCEGEGGRGEYFHMFPEKGHSAR